MALLAFYYLVGSASSSKFTLIVGDVAIPIQKWTHGYARSVLSLPRKYEVLDASFFVDKDGEVAVIWSIIHVDEEESSIFNVDGVVLLIALSAGDVEEHDEDDEALEKGGHIAFHNTGRY